MRGQRSWVAIAIGLAGLAIPASASAAVTIGSNLAATPSSEGFICEGLGADVFCTLAHRTLPAASTAPDGVLAPTDGVVVRWRIKVGADTTPVALRITRPGNSDVRTGAGTGPTVTPTADTTSTFPVQLPIKAGDAVGIDCCNEARLDAVFFVVEGASLDVWYPRLEDGQPPEGPFGGPFSDIELLVNADIEPDADCDAMGDETQDPSVTPPGNCPQPAPEPEPQPLAKADRTLTLDANKNKVKKGKKVTLSGQVNQLTRQGQCESSQPVQLQRKKPSQTVFTTVEQLQSDAAGSFSTKERVKKTFEYRAQVTETATCGGQISNTEKVKVKKKR
jgi:hypothetical protein